MPKRNESGDKYHRETRLIHGDFHSVHWNYEDHIIPPISASCAYRLESADRGAQGFQAFADPGLDRKEAPPIYIYDRLDEPSRGMLENNLAAAEEGECGVAFATGMAAIRAALGVLLNAGDAVVAHHTMYGCTYSLFTRWFPRFGVEVRFVDLRDVDAIPKLLTDEVKAVYFETPSNPVLELIDIAAVRKAVDAANAGRDEGRKVHIVVDNTFATPHCQRPLTHGADLVCHSLTKNIGGFGTDMGGVVVGPRKLEPDLLLFRKDLGAPLAPRCAWPHLVYGLPTLSLRSRRQIETAMKVAAHLENHEMVAEVLYPGLPSHPQHELAKKQMVDVDGNFAPGIMLSFLLEGDDASRREKGRRMMDHLAENALSVTLAVSLGQIRTLIEHPSSMTHAPLSLEAQRKAGIDPGLIRISMGIEHPDDIIRDLDEALDMARKV